MPATNKQVLKLQHSC